MEKRIKLICFYDKLNTRFKRKFILSATTKIDYIIGALNKLGYAVDIISAATAEGGQLSISKTQTIGYGVNSLTLFGCIALPSKSLTHKISSQIVTRKLKRYLENNVSEEDVVIVYHSPKYAKLLSQLRKRIGFTLIGEIEEIYQDVRSMGKILDAEEYDFFAACDKFIFPTQLLNDKLNCENKRPSITIHGLYNVEKDRKVSFNDGKIHVVYAGTFDPRKGGAAAAAAAAAFLPENYHLHICGFGSFDDTENIKKVIASLNGVSKARVSYDGMKRGEDFINFIQRCEIGLSTQNPDAAFNATSFPSKVLNYLSNGLKVVTIDIPAIRQSTVGEYLFYYKKQTPENIAQAIIEAHEQTGFDGRSLLRALDKRFVGELSNFLQ